MNPASGTILRLLGPLLQTLCLIGLLSTRGQGRLVAGFPAEYLFYAGFAIGLLLVLVGLALSRGPRRPPPADKPPSDFRL